MASPPKFLTYLWFQLKYMPLLS